MVGTTPAELVFHRQRRADGNWPRNGEAPPNGRAGRMRRQPGVEDLCARIGPAHNFRGGQQRRDGSGSPRKRFAPSGRKAKNGRTVFIYPILLKNSLPYEIVKDISRHLIDSVRVIYDLGGQAILPLDADVFSVPIVFSLDYVIVPRRNQIQKFGL
ncbi:MAG: hypothetical protein ACLPX9_00345 [Rhodomicrobium sp.]